MPGPDLQLLRTRLGVEVPDDILLQALTHRSFAYENGNLRPNERLEFLGDSVLGLVVTDELFHRYPDAAEGQLAKMRAGVVNSVALADVARSLGLGEFILLGKGEDATGGREKKSILADTMEAIMGAIYISRGMVEATSAILRLTASKLAATASLGAGLDWKTSLQELSARLGLGAPEYQMSAAGPDHDKTFTAIVRLQSANYGIGTGSSKKIAEQNAARQTYQDLGGPEVGV